MAEQSSKSGGFFLMAAILIGFGGGVAGGDPMKGVLVGTVIGIGIAVLIWLTDPARRRGS